MPRAVLNILLLLLTGVNCEDIFSKFHQGDFKIKYQRTDLVLYDDGFAKQFSAANFKYNRTHFATNFTFELSVDAGNDLQILIQARKFMSNEYRLFPIHFLESACAFLKYDIVGLRSASKNQLQCPLQRKVVYKVNNFYPEESMLPPFIPSGEYRIDVTYLYFGKEVAFGSNYVGVYRPIAAPSK